MLPTVLYLSKVLAKLAMGLDRRPELIAHLGQEGRSDRGEAAEKVTLVEQSANVVREAFIKCLTDRSGGIGVHEKPEGKRVGIYLMANLCLKLLFQVIGPLCWSKGACTRIAADDPAVWEVTEC
jgi:nuclear mRNA export protein PCID2/THP1